MQRIEEDLKTAEAEILALWENYVDPLRPLDKAETRILALKDGAYKPKILLMGDSAERANALERNCLESHELRVLLSDRAIEMFLTDRKDELKDYQVVIIDLLEVEKINKIQQEHLQDFMQQGVIILHYAAIKKFVRFEKNRLIEVAGSCTELAQILEMGLLDFTPKPEEPKIFKAKPSNRTSKSGSGTKAESVYA